MGNAVGSKVTLMRYSVDMILVLIRPSRLARQKLGEAFDFCQKFVMRVPLWAEPKARLGHHGFLGAATPEGLETRSLKASKRIICAYMSPNLPAMTLNYAKPLRFAIAFFKDLEIRDKRQPILHTDPRDGK